jgi:uncharacterized protein
MRSASSGQQWKCCFEVKVKRAVYVRTWGHYRGRRSVKSANGKDGFVGDHFRFWQEIRPSALDMPGGDIRIVADLLAWPDLTPFRYKLDVNGAKTALAFSDEHVQVSLPDGSETTCSATGAAYLLGANMAPQLELIFQRVGVDRLPDQIRYFSPETLSVMNYELHVDAGKVTTNLGEHITLDHRKRIKEIATVQDVKVVRVDRPLPRWRTNRAGRGSKSRFFYKGANPSVGARTFDLRVQGPIVELGATLAIPTNCQPFAAALFIGGSGTHDRHGFTESLDLGYHSLLDRLAAGGIVSLRFDKRGSGSTAIGHDLLDFGFDAVVADAAAALRALQERSEAAGLPVFLIGHSQGGLVAMRLALQQRDVSGIALLATPGKPIDQVIEEQMRANALHLELSADALAQQLKDHAEFFECVRRVREWEESLVPPKVFARRRQRRFFAELLAYSPTELVSLQDCPLLIMQGTEDEQVSVDNAERLRDAAAKLDVSFHVVPGVDHLFKRPKDTGRMAAYNDRRHHFSSHAVKIVSDWIATRSTPLDLRQSARA